MSNPFEFKTYFDLCVATSTRTRNSLYLLLAVFVAVFTVYLNTHMLRFAATRMEKLDMAYRCMKSGNLIPIQIDPDSHDECARAIRWAGDLGLPTSYIADRKESDIPPISVKPVQRLNAAPYERKEALALYQAQLNVFMGKRADLRSITVPLFGSVLDLEDLGILSGIGFVILLLVVRANMHRELDAFNKAKDVIAKSWPYDPGARDEATRLLQTIQVLASPKRDNLGVKWLVPASFLLAPGLHFAVWADDYHNPKNVSLLLGPDIATRLVLVEEALLVILVIFSVIVARLWVCMVMVTGPPVADGPSPSPPDKPNSEQASLDPTT